MKKLMLILALATAVVGCGQKETAGDHNTVERTSALNSKEKALQAAIKKHADLTDKLMKEPDEKKQLEIAKECDKAWAEVERLQR